MSARVHATLGYFAIHVVTDEPDALFARAVAAGAKVVRPLAELVARNT